MEVAELIRMMETNQGVREGTEAHDLLVRCSNEAMRITAELNGSYHTPEEIRGLVSQLIGKPLDDGFTMFPPFYTDFGKNISIGRGVFINAGCSFQDQGGVVIGDGVLIGHRVVLATINHGLRPEERHTCICSPIVIGRNVWIGAGAIVLPGVTIGDDAVVAAGAVVTRDVAAGDVVAGVPAKRVRNVHDA